MSGGRWRGVALLALGAALLGAVVWGATRSPTFDGNAPEPPERVSAPAVQFVPVDERRVNAVLAAMRLPAVPPGGFRPRENDRGFYAELGEYSASAERDGDLWTLRVHRATPGEAPRAVPEADGLAVARAVLRAAGLDPAQWTVAPAGTGGPRRPPRDFQIVPKAALDVPALAGHISVAHRGGYELHLALATFAPGPEVRLVGARDAFPAIRDTAPRGAYREAFLVFQVSDPPRDGERLRAVWTFVDAPAGGDHSATASAERL